MVAFLLYFLSSAIHLLVHESGHFIGGVVSEYKLLCLQLGPMNIVVGTNNKPSILWKGSLSGQCVMLPKHIENVRFNEMLYYNEIQDILNSLTPANN